jgi:hypothetical protein
VGRRQGTHGNAIDEGFALVLETTSWECARVETADLTGVKTRGCGYGFSENWKVEEAEEWRLIIVILY